MDKILQHENNIPRTVADQTVIYSAQLLRQLRDMAVKRLPAANRGPAKSGIEKTEVRLNFYLTDQELALFPDNDPRPELKTVCKQAIDELIESKKQDPQA